MQRPCQTQHPCLGRRTLLLACCLLIGCDSPSSTTSTDASPSVQKTTPAGNIESPPKLADHSDETSTGDVRPLATLIAGQSEVANRLQSHLKNEGTLRFDSHQGQSTSTEGGMTLTLSVDGTAAIEYHGSDPATSTGSFTVTSDDQVHLNFGPNDPWPPMPVVIVEDNLQVGRPDQEQIIRMAVNAGIDRNEITEEDIQAAYQPWPLLHSPSQD